MAPELSERHAFFQETDQGEVEVAAIDSMASMQAIDIPELGDVAAQVQAKLKKVVQSL